ncbi:hypothetical protein BGZ82_001861 [Podila clonocystis]|nr:hypothetical protein BGZ82_001861 [Podila clonocystis]
MAMFPPLAPHHSFSSNNTLLLQDPIQLTSLSNHDQKEIQLKQQQLEQQHLRLRQQQEQAILHQHHLQRQQVQQHPLNVAPFYNPLKYDGMRESGHHPLPAPKGLYSPDGVSRNLGIPSGSARTFVAA